MISYWTDIGCAQSTDEVCRPTFTTGFVGKHVELFCKELHENCHSISVLLFLGTFAKFRKATISFIMSVCPSVRLSAWNNSDPTGQIFMKINIREFFENLLRKFNSH
jgi:hypothetical protein